MATVGSVGDAITGVRSQLQSKTFASNDVKVRAFALLDAATIDLKSHGLATGTGSVTPSAVSVTDALTGLRAQVATATYGSAYDRIASLARVDQLVAELGALGVS